MIKALCLVEPHWPHLCSSILALSCDARLLFAGAMFSEAELFSTVSQILWLTTTGSFHTIRLINQGAEQHLINGGSILCLFIKYFCRRWSHCHKWRQSLLAAVSEIFYQLLRCPPRSSMLCIFPPFLSQTSLNTSPPADLLQHFKGSKPFPTQPFLNGMSFILVCIGDDLVGVC